MRKSWFALVAGAALVGWTSTASADKSGTKGSKGGMESRTHEMGSEEMKGSRADEPKKHLSVIDVYLHDAMNNTKVLYESTQLMPGKLDAVIQREGVNNIDKAISNAMTHISHIRSLSEARLLEMDKLDTLQKDLTQSRQMVMQLRSVLRAQKKDELASLSSQLFTRLKEADDTFNSIADKQNLTRVDKITVPERQPVGGREEVRPGETVPPPQKDPSQGEKPATPGSSY